MKAKESRYNLSVNGLRGVSALLVFLYHIVNSGLIHPTNAVANALMYFGSSFRYGVEVFFMISGYVLMLSIKRHSRASLFLRDRVIRIFPAWIPVHIAMFIGGSFLGWAVFAGDHDGESMVTLFVTNLLFLPPIIPLPLTHPAAWSLSYEWAFYLLLTVFAYLASKNNPWLKWTVRILLCFIPAFVLLNLFPRALFFLPGVAAALLTPWLDKHRQWFKLPLLASILFLLAWRTTDINSASPQVTDPTLFWMLDWRAFSVVAALLLGFYFFAGVCFGEKGVLHTVLQHRSFQLMGSISYSFYLWHPLLMSLTKRMVVGSPLLSSNAWVAVASFGLLSFAVSFLVSYQSWALMEQRVGNWLKSLMARARPVVRLVPPAEADASKV